MKQLWDRFLAKTPKLFKTIRNIGLSLVGLSGIILTSGLAIPESIIGIISQIGIIAGATAAGIAQLTTIWGVDEDGNVIK